MPWLWLRFAALKGFINVTEAWKEGTTNGKRICWKNLWGFFLGNLSYVPILEEAKSNIVINLVQVCASSQGSWFPQLHYEILLLETGKQEESWISSVLLGILRLNFRSLLNKLRAFYLRVCMLALSTPLNGPFLQRTC